MAGITKEAYLYCGAHANIAAFGRLRKDTLLCSLFDLEMERTFAREHVGLVWSFSVSKVGQRKQCTCPSGASGSFVFYRQQAT